MNLVGRALLAGVFLFFCSCENPQAADVQFAVSGSELESLPYRVGAFESNDGKDYSWRFTDKLRAENVPFGTYAYSLVRKDISISKDSVIRGQIKLNKTREFIAVSPDNLNLISVNGREAFTERNYHQLFVVGRFEGIPKGLERKWVRVYAVPVGAPRDYPISDSGEFEFEAIRGNYIIALVGGNRLLHAVPVYFAGEKSEIIRLQAACCNGMKN